MSRPFMPFYDGDWMRDTAHLDDAQERAYFRLVMFYWANEGLPSDERQLRLIVHKHHHWWHKNRHVLASFFEVTPLVTGESYEGGKGLVTESYYWAHKRIDYELSKSEKFLEKQRINGAKGNVKRWSNDPQGDRQTIARARVPQPYKEERKKEKDELTSFVRTKRNKENMLKNMKLSTVISPNAQPDVADEEFAAEHKLDTHVFAQQWEQFRDHHLKVGSAFADWHAAWRSWVRNVPSFHARAGPNGNGHTRDDRPKALKYPVQSAVAIARQILDEKKRREQPLEIGRHHAEKYET